MNAPMQRAALDDLTVLIPAAGRVPEGLLGLASSSSAMIPVAGRPVIYWTIHYLKQLGARRFLIAVRERGQFVEEFLRCTFGHSCEIEFVVPERDLGLGFTVSCLAQRTSTGSALVVLGDTYFKLSPDERLDDNSSWVLCSEVQESQRWCMVRADAQGRVAALADKPSSWTGPMQALIGVYKLGDAARLARSAAAAVTERAGQSVQMSDVLRRYAAEGNEGQTIQTRQAADWLDCGNPDNLARSQKRLLPRAFNQIEVDETFGILTKESHDVAKFRDEIAYVSALPRELAVLFPRVIESDVEASPPRLVMEYYGYPTLAEMFLYEDLNLAVWEQIFAHLFALIDQGFMRFPCKVADQAYRQIYVDKTRERVATLLKQPAGELATLVEADELVVNGRKLRGLPRLWPDIERAVAGFAQVEHGTVIHGDLCFSNVLYDVRNRICKLLDPRGSFGTPGIHGDIKYDVAKLHHSVHGLYDFLVSDLFELHLAGTTVDLRILQRPHHAAIAERFRRTFFAPGRFDSRAIHVVTGLLFLSMPALHYDHPRRQAAMYVRGLELLAEAFA